MSAETTEKYEVDVKGTSGQKMVVVWLLIILAGIIVGIWTWSAINGEQGPKKSRSAQTSKAGKDLTVLKTANMYRGQAFSIKYDKGFMLRADKDVHIQPIGPDGQKLGRAINLSKAPKDYVFKSVIVTAPEACTLQVVKEKSSFLPWK